MMESIFASPFRATQRTPSESPNQRLSVREHPDVPYADQTPPGTPSTPFMPSASCSMAAAVHQLLDGHLRRPPPSSSVDAMPAVVRGRRCRLSMPLDTSVVVVRGVRICLRPRRFLHVNARDPKTQLPIPAMHVEDLADLKFRPRYRCSIVPPRAIFQTEEHRSPLYCLFIAPGG